MEPFYVHSVEFWGGLRKWAVFERQHRGWRQVSERTWFRRESAEKDRDRRNADWRRYRVAMWDKGLCR